jgi:hypothetical protein
MRVFRLGSLTYTPEKPPNPENQASFRFRRKPYPLELPSARGREHQEGNYDLPSERRSFASGLGETRVELATPLLMQRQYGRLRSNIRLPRDAGFPLTFQSE